MRLFFDLSAAPGSGKVFSCPSVGFATSPSTRNLPILIFHQKPKSKGDYEMYKSKEFDYDLWTTQEGGTKHYWARVKATGEVAEISIEVMRFQPIGSG